MTKEETKAKLMEQGKTEQELEGKTKAELEAMLQPEGEGHEPKPAETFATRQEQEANDLREQMRILVEEHGYTYEGLQGRTADELANMIRNKTVNYQGEGFADIERLLAEKGQQLGREDDKTILEALRGTATDAQIAEAMFMKWRNTQRDKQYANLTPAPEKGETKAL